jgi:O-antigen/teichoic acid export membrane protein
VIEKILDKFSINSDRSSNVSKNIIFLMLVRGLTMVTSFFLVRVTYEFLGDKAVYGVWLTILSVLSWINYFDVGLGNGLRNKLAESLSNGNEDEAKEYVSTSYIILGFFVFVLMIIYSLISKFINWNQIFNIEVVTENKLNIVLFILIIGYLLRFLLSLIKSVSFANQDAVVPAVILFFSNLLVVSTLYIFQILGFNGLLNLSIIYSIIFVFVFLFANIYLYSKKYRDIVPNVKYYSKEKISNIFNLGIKFFIIQIAALIIFTTDNMIITQVLGPEYVTNYQILFKLFNVFLIASSVILTPLWSAFTDAYTKNDYIWMKNILKRLILLMIPLIIAIVIVGFFSNNIIKLWLGESLNLNSSFIVLMSIMIVLRIWSNIFAYISNGISRMKVQFYTVTFGAIINIPLSIYFAKNLKMGNNGVVLGSILSLSVFAILGPIDIFNKIWKR